MTSFLKTEPGNKLMEIINKPNWEKNDTLVKKAQKLLKEHEKLSKGYRMKVYDDFYLYILATNKDGQEFIFDNYQEASKYFGVSRSLISRRADEETCVKRGRLKGWKFERVYE